MVSPFTEGDDRHPSTPFSDRLDDYVAKDSVVRVIDVVIDDLGVSALGFKREPHDSGRPASDPSTLLKIFVYGYLNGVHSSRRKPRLAVCRR